MSIAHTPVLLSLEEQKWIDEQVNIFHEIKQNQECTALEVKRAVDSFYEGLSDLYFSHPTKMLKKCYTIGYDYEGMIPSRNRNFMALYQELIEMIEDYVVDKPLKYFIQEEGKLLPVLEYEDGTVEFLKNK